MFIFRGKTHVWRKTKNNPPWVRYAMQSKRQIRSLALQQWLNAPHSSKTPRSPRVSPWIPWKPTNSSPKKGNYFNRKYIDHWFSRDLLVFQGGEFLIDFVWAQLLMLSGQQEIPIQFWSLLNSLTKRNIRHSLRHFQKLRPEIVQKECLPGLALHSFFSSNFGSWIYCKTLGQSLA